MNDETMTKAVLMHPMTPEAAVDLIHTLIRQRDQARRIAAHLEAESAQREMDDDQNDDHMTLLRNAWRVAVIDRDKYQLQNAELLGRLNKLTNETVTSEIQRWQDNWYGSDHGEMTPGEDGEYVKYVDHLEELRQAQTLYRIGKATDGA